MRGRLITSTQKAKFLGLVLPWLPGGFDVTGNALDQEKDQEKWVGNRGYLSVTAFKSRFTPIQKPTSNKKEILLNFPS